jgi:nucleoside-diphosphate-sugar epimerase/phytoene/squalene synthetase
MTMSQAATVTALRRRASDDDWAFCDDTLPKVSRTFALSIAALPKTLRDPICVAYLLCRIVDTIEDDAVVKHEARDGLFDVFDRLMGDDTADPGDLEQGTVELRLGQGTHDHELCRESGRVFRCFRSLPLEQRAAVRPHVLEMSRGMREFTRRADAVGKLRLRDLGELERYCYFVAGTVGKLLTALFELQIPDLPDHLKTPIRARAISFGLALQLVNIVKDVATDHVRGDCFLPEAIAEEEGVSLDCLLDPAHRDQGVEVIRRICSRSRDHLRRAEEYTLLWPTPEATQIRLFCAVPLVLALATLREVEVSEDTLSPGKTPKVSREVVAEIFGSAHGAVQSDAALMALFERHGGGHARVVGSKRGPRPVSEVARASGGAPQSEGGSAATPLKRRYTGKALVTGAAGHLGANMVHRLLADGQEVRVLLRDGSDNEAMEGLAVEKIMGDLRDPPVVRRAVDGCETVYHCAARVSTLQGDRAHKREIFECNVMGTRNLLRAAKECGVARVAVTGSFGANGYDLDDPTLPADEENPFYPFNTHLPYAESKHMCEHEVLRAAVEGLDVVMCTSTAILGPHDYKPSRMGRTLCDYTHGKLRAYIPGGFEFVAAKDICEGHVLAMERGRTGQKYTFATEFLTLDDIMEIWEEVTGVPRPRLRLPPGVMYGLAHVSSFVLSNFFPKVPQRFTPDAVRILRMQRRADISKARGELGFEPSDIRDSIRDAYDDFARRGLVPPRMRIVDEEAPRSSRRATAA